MSALLPALTVCLSLWGGPVNDTIPVARVVYRDGSLPSVRISGEALAASPTAADAIRSETGLQLKDYGGVGGLKTVNVRSLGSEHVGVYVDGIAIDQAQNMQVDLGRISLWSMGGIELYHGQKDAQLQTAKEYGTASALHFSTARPAKNRLRARLSGGSFGIFMPALSLERMLGDRLALRVNAEYTRTDGDYRYRLSGYREREGEWQRFDTTLVRENGDLQSVRAEAELFADGRLGKGRIRLSAYDSERGLPGPVVRRADVFPLSADRQEDRDLALQGEWRSRIGRYELALRGKYANDYMRYATHPELNPMALPYDNYYRQQSAYLSLAQHLNWRRLDFSLATDLQYNTLDSDAGQFVEPSRLSFFGAAALSWNEPVHASASLLYTHVADHYDREAGGYTREDNTRRVLSPFVNLEYRKGAFIFGAFAKRSFRMPSFNDLYYAFIGNANLRPEDARQLSASVRYERPLAEPWRLSSRVEAYHNRVIDKIVAIPTASQFRWTMLNLGKVDIDGAELEASLHHDGALQGCLTGRYTYQRAVNRLEPNAGSQIPYVPLHSGSLSASLGWKGWSAGWTSVFTGKRYSTTSNTPDYAVDPFSLSDLRLEKRLEGRKCLYIIRFQLNNVFGSRYEVVQHYPMPGRHFLAGLEIAF